MFIPGRLKKKMAQKELEERMDSIERDIVEIRGMLQSLDQNIE